MFATRRHSFESLWRSSRRRKRVIDPHSAIHQPLIAATDCPVDGLFRFENASAFPGDCA